MKLKNCVLLLTILLTHFANGQSKDWSANPRDIVGFTENKGQIPEIGSKSVEYAYEGHKEGYYFSGNSLTIKLFVKDKREKSQEEKEARKTRKEKGFENIGEWNDFEKEGFRMDPKEDELIATWAGASENCEIIAEEKNSFYHNFTVKDANGNEKNLSNVPSYLKLTYKEIYPNIDIVYEFYKEGGLKYSIVVRPGGDISKVKLKYSKALVKQENGSLITATSLGNIIDHAPVTFYKNNTEKIISSSYITEGNVIGFSVGQYDPTKTIVIDPWTQTPNFPSTNWDSVWECERDAAGNVYIIGGTSPLQLIKYNASGTIQWTYSTPYDTTEWLGTFAVDNAGNSYVANGSPARMVKVNTGGGVVWNNTNPGGIFTSTEFWNITFNCDQTKLIVGGTGGFLPPLPYIYDVDMNNGNITASVQVTGGELFPTQEVRAVTACGNGKYYWMTHDSLGYIHQSLTGCAASNTAPTYFSSGYVYNYKCENYRYNNSGIMALAYYNNFIFVHRGNQLHKRDFFTGAILATVNIPGGSFPSSLGRNAVGCSGIDIDDCGNIFVGSTNGVYKFDQNLSQTGSYATTFNVYDVEVNLAGDIVSCGSTGTSSSGSRTGSVQVFAASACTPQATVCCDATICPPTMACTNDAPFAISSITSGGTWSASCGSCINASTGVFSPSLAGQGSFTVTYTISCGSESITVYVNDCTPLDVCIEANGTYTVSGGTGPYNWSEYSPASSTPITSQLECVQCNSNYSWIPFINSCFDGVFPVANCNNAAGYDPFATGTNITPGTNFPIMVEDFSGQSYIINDPSDLLPCSGCPTLTVTTSSVIATCNGQSTGSFSASTAAGVGPYDYTLLLGASTIATFSNVAGSQSFTGLAAGTYTLNVLDNNGCPGTVTVTINSNPAITITQTSITPASCGSNNGSVTVSASGGSGSFTYSWNSNPVQTGATASNLAAGPYIVTATDALGCTQTFNVTITSAGGPTVTITNPVNPTCNNGTNGTATASVSGGTGTMDYAWSPAGGTAATGTGLSGGILYTVTVTDDNGCVGIATITLTNPTAIAVTTSATDANCGASDGTLTASASGGTGTLDYSWSTSPVQNTATATAVPAGTYTVTVTDDNGCTATATQSVNNVGAPTISIVSQTDVTCNGGNDGAAVVSGSGGTGGLTYSWNTNPVQTGTTASALTAGTYTATVTDGAGCSASVTVTIIEPTAITGTTTNTPANCAASDGTASVTASGGDGNYTYLWSNNATTASISGLAPGTYTVTITDGNGCTGTATAIVGTVSTANINAGPDVVITTGSTTTLVATGGVTYSWTPSTGLSCTNCSSPDANPDTTTMYIVTATDANGCVGSDTVIVYVEEPCGNLWVPTAFSPNADYNNDKLCVYGGCILSMTFQIFDRWGEVVFETTTNELCWDGYYKDKQMNSGVFAYYLIATLSNGDVVEKSGNITLVR
jgi:gliding motility-associated-like protein